MGVEKVTRRSRRFNPKPKINYPPVPTKKWIQPDLRPKKVIRPPQLKYKKPRGMDQRVRPSALRKIWRHYLFYEDTAILTGSFSQTHKRFTFKSNGLQSACNCALACVFAHIRPMEAWDQYLMDYILILGDLLFRKSLEQDPDRCWTEIPTDRVYTSVYIGTTKVSFEVDIKNRIDETIRAVNEDKIKKQFQDVVEKVFSLYFCALFSMDGCKKVLAIWYKNGIYYLFDPTAHTSCGLTWANWPGGGLSITYRCKTMEDFINRLYENITCHGDIILENLAHCHCLGALDSKLTSKLCRGRFRVEPCVVLRVIEIDTTPPDKYEDVRPIPPEHEICFRTCSCPGLKGILDKRTCKDQIPPTDAELAGLMEFPVDIWERRLKKFLEDEEQDNDPKRLEIQELAPEVTNKLSLSKRPSWLQEEFDKSDYCKFPIPYSKRPEVMSFYLDIEPGLISIMRANTHIRDPDFTKYMGRQSMGDAISSLTMLKFWKAKHWVPVVLNRILKFGDLLYRDAMISIPRTQSLKLSNFQKKTEYLGKYFLPMVEDYVVVGRLSCKEFDVTDLFVALESFLMENQCCVIIGPITLSVWVEDGLFYMFDPNERDNKGNAMHNYEEPMRELDCVCPSGKACLMRFKKIEDLVSLYMSNVEKPYRTAPFYLSKVQIMDWVDIPDAWHSFKGVAPGKWILRGTISQNERQFDPKTRNFQSPATSMVMMAMKKLKPIKEWVNTDINELLELGDRLYVESIDALAAKGLYNNKMLMLSDINKEFRFWEKLVEFNLDECVSNGIFTAKNENDVLNLYKALCYYFVAYDLGIVTCRNMSVAVWRFDDMFFYCDSHSRDENGLTTPFGTACMVRTCTLEDIANMIMCNFAPNPEDYFNITNVVMTFYDLDAEGFIKPVILYYRKVNEHKFILRSLFSQCSNKYELNACKQLIPMCFLAISYNKLKPSVEWNQADLDEILNKGNTLYVQSMLDILKKEETEFISDTMEHEVSPSGVKKARESRSSAGSSETGTAKSSEGTKSSETDEHGDSNLEDLAASTAEIKIHLDNVKKEFKIGLNKFTVIVEDAGSGFIEPDLKTALKDYFEKASEEAKPQSTEPSDMSSSGKEEASTSGETKSSSTPKGTTAPAFVDESNMELLFLTETYSVIFWTDSKLFYLFDPNPRDKNGNIFGADEWSSMGLICGKRPPKQEVCTEGTIASEFEEPRPSSQAPRQSAPAPQSTRPSEAPSQAPQSTRPSEAASQAARPSSRPSEVPSQKSARPSARPSEQPPGESGGGGEGAGDGDGGEGGEKAAAADKPADYDAFQEGEGGMEVAQEEEGFYDDYGEYEAIVEAQIPYPKDLKSASYWAELAKGGRACTLAFPKVEALLDHVTKCFRPKLRAKESFQLKTIRVTNIPERVDILRPEDIRNDVYEGKWYDFTEVDRGIWILRGTLSLLHELFPIYNRGKQQLMTAICYLGVVYTFGVICFNQFTVDTILKYGDRLLTFAKKVRKKQMKEYDPDKLCDDEIDWLLQHEEFGIKDVPKKICIWKFMIHVECHPEIVIGDVKAEPFEQLADVKRGVDKFFEENRFGILQSKDLAVAIWKGGRLFFMGDGLNRGPNGLTAACGTGCVTRYVKTEDLVKTFLSNLTRLGNNNFYIHGVTFGRDICPRVRTPKVYIPPDLKCVANVCKEIFPGKTIVRGSITQDDPKFGKQPKALSLPIAFIALTMTLLHKTQIWSKPIVDDIIEIGNELYDISVDSLGYDFNPWEDKLNVCQVKHDFFVGVLKANLEVRTGDQKGIIEPPDPCTFNLRMGIKKFFDENTHGIVITTTLTIAIWEEEIEGGDPLIYIFDPNARGPTGLPAYNGVACLISCSDPRMAAAHICSCILDQDQKAGPFKILPVEIVIGKMRTQKKTKRIDTRSSLNVLPRCTQDAKLKENRLLRKFAEFDRRKRQYRKLQLVGRKAFYVMKNGDSIIRGCRSTNSECYPCSARNNQDLPMCIAALVLHSLFAVENWTYKNVDLVMDTGNQLYLDSYIAYNPVDVKLGPENIIRKFFLKHLIVKVTIYKPIITDTFCSETLYRILNIYFSQEPFCMLSRYNEWVSLIAKSGHFYMFDPHPRDIEGNVLDEDHVDSCVPGTAVVIKFDSMQNLVDRLISNLPAEPPDKEPSSQEKIASSKPSNEDDEEKDNLFTLWLISVQIR